MVSAVSSAASSNTSVVVGDVVSGVSVCVVDVVDWFLVVDDSCGVWVVVVGDWNSSGGVVVDYSVVSLTVWNWVA